MRLCSLLPPAGPDVGVLEELPEITEAMEDCRIRMDGSHVDVVEDVGGQSVVEIMGSGATVVFKSAAVEPLLFVYVKTLDKFFSFTVEVIDGCERYYTLDFSNRRGHIKVDGSTLRAPVHVEDRRWQYLQIDLARVLRDAFDADYFCTIQVAVHASCRLFKLYLADGTYADLELPPHLRVLSAVTPT